MDNHSDEWVATDALGRQVKYERAARADRTVAMFYFLWLEGEHWKPAGPWDITRILKTDPGALQKPNSPLWGPEHSPHFWGEPLFGYYNTDDEWVLRKHAEMLADAGVDVIIFDTSNKLTYPKQAFALFRAFEEERKNGNKTPQVAFLTPFWDPASTVDRLWQDIYSKKEFEDLWFRWEGKPLILADPDKVNPKLRNFFTFRKPQPDYFNGPEKPDMWSWLEVAPQHVFRNSQGEAEQMSVGVAQNAVDGKLSAMSNRRSLGRSYHNGNWDRRTNAVDYGLNFQEQWDNALRADPRAVFVTGWNEWIAGRFHEFNGYRAPVIFVDEFDQEHSRDIEPMKGGHGDNYYYQLAENIRKYKGARPPRVAGPEQSIDLSKDFRQWDKVTPAYYDEVGDIFARNHPGYNTVTRYVDHTGRNDLVEMKVARDAKNLYFYARTKNALTQWTDPNWMTLFINVDGNAATGWHGYDFLVNHRIRDGRHSILESTRHGWNWEPVADVAMRVQGNEVMLAIPKTLLGISGDNIRMEFKWADNWKSDDNLDEFTLHGDAAPPGRFNYLYMTKRQ